MKLPVVPDAALDDSLDREREQVAAAQRGDLDAMRPIFERYAGPLYGTVILPRLGDPATAEDVLRDTFSTALHKIHQFSFTGRPIYVWLRQIATNKVYDVHRKTKRSRRLADALAVEMVPHTAPEARPDVQLMAAEERRTMRARIDAAMAELPERYREAITLRLIRERPRDECAQALGVKTATFDVILFRAVRAFRKRYGDSSP
ncbi:MAG TPA: RNA polymerase sigma factor [Kofleriaceae bacterium]|nr:RNA polymerase sigma factor [Kofleriaceae bacterium]